MSDQQSQPGGMSYADIARALDSKATALLESGNIAAGGDMRPVIAGALTAVCRAQLATMPRGTQAMQVLQALAPTIQHQTMQLVAQRDGAGQGAPKIPPADVKQSAFDAIQQRLTEAAIPTFVLMVAGDLVLLSLEVVGGHVRSHASLVDVEAVRQSVGHVIGAHVAQAVLTWSNDNDAVHHGIAVLLAGMTADQATTILLEHLAGIVVRSSTDLPTALSILQGFGPDLEAAVKGGWLEQREEAGRG